MTALVLVTPRTQVIPDIEGAWYAGVDAGLNKLLERGISPVFACGDFDSSGGEPPETECKIFRFPPEKDETDSELAVTYAVKEGYDPIILTGALSGRIDHTVALLRLMMYRYPQILLTDVGQEARILLPGVWETDGSYHYISLFAVTPSRISLSGMKYPLQNHSLVPSDIFTISNEVSSDKATVTVHEGMILMIRTDLP